MKPSDNFGPPLRLASRKELACELTKREGGMALAVFEQPDGALDCAYVIMTEDGRDIPVHVILRRIADIFEGGCCPLTT
mgnify:CR=1 FL=1